VKSTLKVVIQAIRGEVVVTVEIMDAINAVFDARVPKSWLYRYIHTYIHTFIEQMSDL
jgi:dynein heavy chain